MTTEVADIHTTTVTMAILMSIWTIQVSRSVTDDRNVPNLRVVQESTPNVKCLTSIQGALKSVDSLSGSEGERSLPALDSLGV